MRISELIIVAAILIWNPLCAPALAHGDSKWGEHPLQWSNDQIGRSIDLAGNGRVVFEEGRACFEGDVLALDVRDELMFDIDRVVQVGVVLYDPRGDTEAQLEYDRADGLAVGAANSSVARIEKPFGHLNFRLDRARFANLREAGSDLVLTKKGKGPLVICDVQISGADEKSPAAPKGRIKLNLIDEGGLPTTARVGLFDSQGRLPLPSSDAGIVQSLAGKGRVVQFFRKETSVPIWPMPNRSAFYVSGQYGATLPAGDYDLVVTKGLEYRSVRRKLTVKPDQITAVAIKLERWRDMAKSGWFSGDDHVHYALESDEDERSLLLFAQAEDLKVTNVLHVGNAAYTYFPNRSWRTITDSGNRYFALVPGQEDPRTSRRGHSLSLNIKAPVRDAARYPLYDEVFNRVHKQGGLTGYAHIDEHHKGVIHGIAGMAVDVPFDRIDFAEILCGVCGAAGGPSSDWFDFLNLGYKIAPTAGTDYLFGSLPGAVRNYVRLEGPFTPQHWFDALKQGRTFVTSGPMLSFELNGKGMGSEIELKVGDAISISAQAVINPDFGPLATLELIEQGEVRRVVTHEGPSLRLALHTRAKTGTWFVVRATGVNKDMVAISAPVYVTVDGQSFWKPSAVPAIAARMKAVMDEMLAAPVREIANEEYESTQPLNELWRVNESDIQARVAHAKAEYDEIVRRAAAVQ